MRLATVRTLAWALWLGGWLVMASLGRGSGPLIAGGLLPLAVWLAAIGVLLHGSAGWRLRRGALLAALAGSAAVAISGLALQAPLVTAVGWAALVVAASRAVRAVRVVQAGQHGTPIVPAVAGALLAWAAAGDLPGAQAGDPFVALPVLAALAIAAAGLAALLPRHPAPLGGCRSGLFDCAWPLGTLQGWRYPAGWPLAAAMLTMLPMMASLPLMAEGCSSLGWSARWATAAHLAAMLLPGALLQHVASSRWHGHAHRTRQVGGLLAAGGLLLWAWLGPSGLMGAALLHGAAWSMAWAGALAEPRGQRQAGHINSRTALLAGSGVLTGATLVLGLAIEQAGPAALSAVHGSIAALAAAGLLAAGWHERMGRRVA